MTDTIDIPVSRETIQSSGQPPQADSSLYLHRSERILTGGVRQSVIAGVHVVFKAGDANNLYDAFNVPRTEKLNAANLPTVKRALLIACDTLEIVGPLSLPEYDVAIFARRLVFKERGCIDTTPLDWAMNKAPDCDPNKRSAGGDGADGRHAGSLSVFIDGLDAPASESMARFIAKGGRGQDAGHGRDGDDGRSMSAIDKVFKHQDTGPMNTFTADFANPCVFATYHWHWGIVINKGERGSNDWPTSGQDALKPGVPGSAGNGGGWISNKGDLAARAETAAGPAGATAPNVRGGSAGTPTTSTHYDLTIRYNLAGGTAYGDNTLLETHTTAHGQSYDASGPKTPTGRSPEKKTIGVANAWVHPLQLECVLRYARDAFLANAREAVVGVLTPYERAFAAPLPAAADAGLPWVAGAAAKWTSAQAEVASMLHRLRTGLDYFGNPAGYMPLLSLQATLRLYDLETKDALRTLLFAAWVQEKTDREQSAANAFGAAIDDTNKDTARVAEQLVQAEEKMTAIDQQLTALQTRLNGLSNDLGALRTELYNEAARDETRRAVIRAGVKMAAAICQAVPVGQPVLGTIGKLANIAADIKEEGVPDTVSKMGETIGKAREAAKKAKKAKEEAKKKDKDAADGAAAKKKASAWEKAGDGLGPALSMAGEAIGALQVSEEEIEVELAKLIAASPKWKALTESIRALNKDKSALFKQLGAVLHAIGDGYARLAANADALVTLHEERNETLGRLSIEANQIVARMGQAARLSLQRALYLLVKSYETTVLRPIEVDWSLDAVLDKITTLMKPQKGFDAAAINEFAQVVAPLFEANRKTIKQSLLDDYGFADMKSSTLEFGFTAEQTPHRLDDLRNGRRLLVDPLVHGLILPGHERAKALGFECKTLRFSESGPPAPKSGNAIVSLRTDGDGTGRRGEHLYAVRSDAPRVWTWTYHFSDRTLQPSVPSLSSLDLLNMLLQTDSDTIKQKLAAPPAWSGLTIELEFSPPIPIDRRPALESLLFLCAVESLPVSSAQCVLDVRTEAASERIGIQPADLAGRGYGVGASYRIYGNGASVSLTAPARLGERPFSHWDILSSETQRREEKPGVEVRLASNTLAYCRFRPVAKAAPVAHPAVVRVIRAAADPHAAVIGVIADGDEAVVLADGGGGWSKVAYDGLIGYVAGVAAAAVAGV
jgi:cell fate (sporulation/competence/biofilm development) regulator YlbF (YheA/YmcA/DUF963 family)